MERKGHLPGQDNQGRLCWRKGDCLLRATVLGRVTAAEQDEGAARGTKPLQQGLKAGCAAAQGRAQRRDWPRQSLDHGTEEGRDLKDLRKTLPSGAQSSLKSPSVTVPASILQARRSSPCKSDIRSVL